MCAFKRFNLLVYHLHIRKFQWSPTTPAIKRSMKIVQKIVQEKARLKIDQPGSSDRTTSTGNVARRAFSDESNL